jgi:hypothetical protein
VQVGRGDERVDARPRGGLDRLARAIDVVAPAAGERRDRPGRRTSAATARTASASASEAIGKPASITSTPSASSWRASCSFSGTVSEKPGACSPSRRVVSKMTIRSGMLPPCALSDCAQPAVNSIILKLE